MTDKIKEIAQWVIDNRYPKSEKEKVSDSELYNGIIDKFTEYESSEIARLRGIIERAKGKCENAPVFIDGLDEILSEAEEQ